MGLFKRIVYFFVTRYLHIEREIIPIYQPVAVNELLKDKVILITGGTGGIGKVIAKKAIDCGAKVIVSGTNENKLTAIQQSLGQNAKAIKINLSDYISIKQGVEECLRAFPDSKIDILVNSAGIHGDWKFSKLDEKEYDKVINVNIKGTYFITNFVAKSMVEKKVRGHILNISSSSALRPAWTPYQVSKWAIDGMTKGFADLLISKGIIVNGLAPGPTATDMVGMGNSDNLYYRMQPSHRYATPDEIANMAIYLISPFADFIVGDTIYMTGGSGTISYHK